MVMKLIEVVREKKTKKRCIEKNEHGILMHKFVCVCVHVIITNL